MAHQLNIVMYTTTWCPDCVRSKRFLRSRAIPFQEIDIERDSAAARYVESLNDGKRIVPTIIIEREGRQTVLAEPSDKDLARALGIAASAR